MDFDFSTVKQRTDRLKELPAGNPRGKALEQLMGDLLGSIPGVVVADHNVISGRQEAELDLQLSNASSPDGLVAFGRDILVECKSSADPLGSPGVSHFATQVRRRKLPWSIIVSLAGLTGNADDLRAAHSEIRSAAEEGHGILLLNEQEIRALRSAEHFVNVLERKRQKMVGSLRAVTFSADEMTELNPSKRLAGGVGLAGIREAIRVAQMNAAKLVFEAERALPELNTDPVERAAGALKAVDVEVQAHRDDPHADPMWRIVRERLIDVGAAFLRLLDEPLDDPDVKRSVSFDLRTLAPQRLRAPVGTELWDLLTKYYFRQAQEYEGWPRRSSVLGVLALVVEEIIAIDDIDPRDVYDEYD
jgi:hypothetical protein